MKDTGPLLFLSLFLLLLAFFILLNSLATLQETKSRAVITSLAATFRTEVVPDATAQVLISTLGPVPQPEEVVAEIERLWLTAVPVAEVETLTPGRTLQIELSVFDLFVGGEQTLRADRRELLRATARALAARIEGHKALMTLTTGSESLEALVLRGTETAATASEADDVVDIADPAADLREATVTDDRRLPFLRATILARSLVDAGAPPDGLSVGVREGAPLRVRMRFDVVEEASARLGSGAIAPPGDAGGGEGN